MTLTAIQRVDVDGCIKILDPGLIDDFIPILERGHYLLFKTQ
jgi:hypothetical protein